MTILQQNPPSLHVFAEAADDLPLAQAVAAQLGTGLLPSAPQEAEGGILVMVRDGRIQVRENRADAAPVSVTFHAGRNAHRQRFGGGINQHLCRAVGLNKSPGLHIIDANGGYARDAFVLAGFGARITLLEQSPLLCLMVKEALQDAAQDSQFAATAERITVINTDSVAYLQARTGTAADVIYLDPMFPERRKSAAVKKDMQLLHALAGPDTSGEALLQAALQKAARRVVVKRPVHAAPLSTQRLTGEVRATHTRYDIYAPLPAD
ncbi:class I SAM-dependent methyltransferase [Granulosicoccaceae sp. 1_MG-2023]|nr:class I SAM-dependent methyltransferase [Granulosicoccaceae sp. 1_MG-2023]